LYYNPNNGEKRKHKLRGEGKCVHKSPEQHLGGRSPSEKAKKQKRGKTIGCKRVGIYHRKRRDKEKRKRGVQASGGDISGVMEEHRKAKWENVEDLCMDISPKMKKASYRKGGKKEIFLPWAEKK